jgi:hypothetical protein
MEGRGLEGLDAGNQVEDIKKSGGQHQDDGEMRAQRVRVAD